MGRHSFLAGIALVVLLAAASQSGAGSLLPGDTMPTVSRSLDAVDGRSISIDSFRGDSGTMVIFTDNSCPQAAGWEKRIAGIANRYQQELVMTVLVNSNDPTLSPADNFEAMGLAARRMGIKVPYVADPTSALARAFGATRSPEVFLFNGAGRLVYHGAVDDSADDPDRVLEPFLENALGQLTRGEAIAVPVTQAIGCGIKFRE